jgi:hypothetical protein
MENKLTLKQRVNDLEEAISVYQKELIDKITQDVDKVMGYRDEKGNVVRSLIPDWKTEEMLEKLNLPKAVAAGKINPNLYLNQVVQDIPEPYQNKVLENVKAKLKSHYLI